MTIRRVLSCVPLLALAGLPLATSQASAAPPAPTAPTVRGFPDCPLPAFHPGAFPRRPKIDNRFLPLRPGDNTVLRGTVMGDDGKLHPHEIRSTVTDLTKVVGGVRSLIVFERDYEDGQLQESELALEAQSVDGTVWNIGEYPEEYDNGKLVGADSTWMAGIQHAHPGINMLARPRLGTPSYHQGLARSVGFEDCAKVVQTQQRVCTPLRCFGDVLVTDEWAPNDREGGHQLKYYAPNVGVVKVGAAGGANAEVLRLVTHNRLSGSEFDRIRTAVLRQDRRGYRVSPDVYGHTPPACRL